jgi:hypothetical protein
MKVWVTKFWNTKGIYEANAKRSSSSENYASTTQYGDLTRVNPIPLMLGKTAFQKREDAVARVRELRIKKISALRRQLEKLEKMKI